ncbi:hypothetical protein [Bacillus sp. FSL K6-3431]|uniref:hypothetical protein n=1 Tax=Bacillus sp. FSL K6-3431 TaxID=2921500 RepID=UPI0030F79EC8
MAKLTAEQLEAIRKRASLVTEGPWRVYDDYCDTIERVSTGESVARVTIANNRNSDMNFISAARKDVPALLAEVERLRLLNEELIEALFGDAMRKSAEVLVTEIRKKVGTYDAKGGDSD